jgi:hypothetical protein
MLALAVIGAVSRDKDFGNKKSLDANSCSSVDSSIVTITRRSSSAGKLEGEQMAGAPHAPPSWRTCHLPHHRFVDWSVVRSVLAA